MWAKAVTGVLGTGNEVGNLNFIVQVPLCYLVTYVTLFYITTGKRATV